VKAGGVKKKSFGRGRFSNGETIQSGGKNGAAAQKSDFTSQRPKGRGKENGNPEGQSGKKEKSKRVPEDHKPLAAKEKTLKKGKQANGRILGRGSALSTQITLRFRSKRK